MELIGGWCLAVATVLGEAGGEPFDGKVAVAMTIRNRMRLKYASNGTVAGTVLRPLQFSLWNTSDPGRVRVCSVTLDDSHVQECMRAWARSDDNPPPLGGFEKVVLYHADYVSPPWAARARFVRKIGRHLFYEDPVVP